ncbi:hypothetical protein SAMN05421538_102275 [Paracoccus isoporae]|uniref:Methyltransferase domain-containing protein n=1 Tax=Paracoccus isoporae TaxID=591205 RepID=A0A1G6X126_9RHOB|nr:hypothetical protein [Paracoccus isoporae]SDD71759.1 hypothetical protein SAMN05421538_102275 [Paracoccus isoporae]
MASRHEQQIRPAVAERLHETGGAPLRHLRAALRDPVYLKDAPGLVHLPFIFWLVRCLAPRRVVQLGLDDGLSYMALCQALQDGDGRGTALGIADGPPALDGVASELHAARYALISRVIAQPDPPGQVTELRADPDLLVIGPDAGEEMLADWLPRLGRGGVILTHAAQRERVRAQWRRQASFRFTFQPDPDAAPLTLLAAGDELPEGLQALAIQGAGRSDEERLLRRLGMGLRARYESGRLPANRAAAAPASDMVPTPAPSGAHPDQLSDPAAERRQAEHLRDIAVLAQDYMAEIATLQQQNQQLEQALSGNQQALTAARKAAADAAAHAAAETVAHAATQSAQQRDDMAQALEAERAEKDYLAARLGQVEHHLSLLQDELAAAYGQRDDLLKNRAWRVTFPLRLASNALRGKGRGRSRPAATGGQ